MNSIRLFFRTLASSISEPKSYPEFSKRTFSSAAFHLYGKLCLFFFAIGIFLYGSFLLAFPHLEQSLKTLVSETRNLYPPQLIVVIKDGKVSTNAPGPVIVDFPPSVKDEITIQGNLEHLLTIDTGARAEDFLKYRSAFLVTQSSIVTYDKNQGLRIIPLDQSEDIIINKQLVDRVMQILLPYLGYVPAFLVIFLLVLVSIFPIIVGLFGLLWYLFYLLITTILLFIIALIMGKKFTYGQLYLMSMHGLTIPLLYTLLTMLVPGLSVTFVWTGILLVWMVFILSKTTDAKKKSRV